MKLLLTIIVFIGLKLYELTIKPIIWLFKFCIHNEKWDNTQYDPVTAFINTIPTNILKILSILIVVILFISILSAYVIGFNWILMNIFITKMSLAEYSKDTNHTLAIFLFTMIALLGPVGIYAIWDLRSGIINWLKENWNKATQIVNRKSK